MEVSLDPTGATRTDSITLFDCYLAAVKDRFSNIKALLRIAERSFSCMSAATKEVFKEQNWVRIVYPTQHLWTFTMSLKWTLTKLSRNSTKRIIVAYSQEASCSANTTKLGIFGR